MANKKSQYQWKLGVQLPDLEPHSLAKHRIIRRYVERYIEIVTQNSRQEDLRLTFVDGYAGGGTYQSGRDVVPGSPFIFLEAVAAAEARLKATRHKGFSICAEYIFIDNNKHHVDFLRSEIERSPFKDLLDKNVHIWKADFNHRVQDVIKVVKARSPRRGRAIFLLDQFGWSQVTFQSIRTILGSLEKAEIFLTFLVDYLIDYLSADSPDMPAFARIDAPPEFVRELLRYKEEQQVGARAVIQHGLYCHLQEATGSQFYSPFFIKSVEAHRSYWFIHLSQHREARNEIGMIHWAENNTTAHHGGPGLIKPLGFAPGKNRDQLTFDYLFDEHAEELSRAAMMEELPSLVFEALSSGQAPTVEAIYGSRCNDTPIVRPLLEQSIVALRNEGEVEILGEDGRPKPRAVKFDWTDRIAMKAQRTMFGPFSRLGVKGRN